MKNINIKLIDYFICNDKNCGKIFFNDDDNVCKYCGSKETDKIVSGYLNGEILDY